MSNNQKILQSFKNLIKKSFPDSAHPILFKIGDIVEFCKISWSSRHVAINPYPLFILGNQKAGTSVIAALLGELTGLSVSIDLKKEYLLDGRIYEQIENGDKKIDDLIRRNSLDFSRDIIKEANLTIFYNELVDYFEKPRFIFILRDPRDNIRSILNNLNIPGDLDTLCLKKIKKNWHIVLDGTWIGLRADNYIEMMAKRWNFLLDIYEHNNKNITLIKYEDFKKNKIGSIERLAKTVGLLPTNDISTKINFQYQPKGNQDIDWLTFYGIKNLKTIDKICAGRMDRYGYEKTE